MKTVAGNSLPQGSPGDLAAWLKHLESLHPLGQAGIELELDRVRRVKGALQQAQSCPVIVVGGTNGKGSTCAYLEAIYSAAGYRVGCYTSPHLLSYNERVRVDRRPVDDAALCRAFARVESARLAEGPVALTYFEFGTLAAWEVFAEARVDLIVLEVGLGGRLDAVNVYDADCAIVTGVALDHTDWLGPTREAIGFEKAGIFRPGESGRRVAICADPAPPQSLLAHAAGIGADLRLLGRDFYYRADEAQWMFCGKSGARDALPLPALPGACQLQNASAALAAIEALARARPVAAAALARGLREVELAGRFQLVERADGGELILDVAHNPQAAAELAANLAARPCRGRTLAVIGMLGDKDIAGVIGALTVVVDSWFVADLDVPRGASAERVAAFLAGFRADCFASPEQAYAQAVKEAAENDRIVAFGSFYTVAAVLRATQDGA